MNDFKRKVQECRDRAQSLAAGLEIFLIEQPSYKELDDTTTDLAALDGVWVYTQEWVAFWSECKTMSFGTLVADDMDREYVVRKQSVCNHSSACHTRLSASFTERKSSRRTLSN